MSNRIVIRNQQIDQLGVSYSPLYLVGAGQLKTYSEPSNFELQLSTDLSRDGWGVLGLEITNAVNLTDRTQWLRLISIWANALPTWNYFIKLTINASQNDNPERIKRGVAGVLGRYFNDLRLDVTQDSGLSPNPLLNLGSSLSKGIKDLTNLSDSILPFVILGGLAFFILRD